jgi:gamma-glutamyltranspeptidase/glutathione hydrolase
MRPGVQPLIAERLEATGRFGVVSATHSIPAHVAMGILERGGNAFDAACAAGFASQVVEPHMDGLGGEAVILAWPARDAEPTVICGQGGAPQLATLDRVRAADFDMIPDTGMVGAVVPGAFGAWMLLLRDFATFALADVIEAAAGYAQGGFPLTRQTARVIAANADRFRRDWPTSAAAFLPDGAAPAPGQLLTNAPLAETYRRLIAAAHAAGGNRERQIEAARRAFYEGFVAEGIERFARDTAVIDAQGKLHEGFLRADDLAKWRATTETAVRHDFRGATLFKPAAWSQGPAMLQTLALIEPLADASLASPSTVHHVIEALKLAFADREAWYGDSADAEPPVRELLGAEYVQNRCTLITDTASPDLRPGRVDNRAPRLPRFALRTQDASASEAIAERDTSHLNVFDRWGNAVSVTSSGGWLQGSPFIPDLGICLSMRGEMFWLQEGLASSLRPGRRPRTTLTPGFARTSAGHRVAFGTKGADYADQWLVQFCLNKFVAGMGLQAAIDAPMFVSDHFPKSNYPREAAPGKVRLDERAPAAMVAALRKRGHQIEPATFRRMGRICAAMSDDRGWLRAAATLRLPHAVALGR